MADVKLLIVVCLSFWIPAVICECDADRVQTVLCAAPTVADTGSYECDLSNGDSMVIDVYLVEKHSDSDCTFFNGPLSNAPPGGGWKKQGNSIFVVEGCRGTFQYCTTEPTCDEQDQQIISCDSFSEHHVCEAGNEDQIITSVEVKRRKSDALCNYWNDDYRSYRELLATFVFPHLIFRRGTFGYDGRRVWVDKACRAIFRVCVSDGAKNCNPSPCQNGATCQNQGNDYACNCPPGFSGKNCDIVDCPVGHCGEHGICNMVDGSIVCDCLPGYKGDNCDEDINECDFYPCKSAGSRADTCENTIGSYICECVGNGYTGENCDDTPCTGQMQTVQCDSQNLGLDYCNLGVQGSSPISLRLLDFRSDNHCNFKNDTDFVPDFEEEGGFGYDSDNTNRMWANLGCWGIFEYCLNQPPCPGEMILVECESVNGSYEACPAVNDNDDRTIVYASVYQRKSDVLCNYRSAFTGQVPGGFNFGQTGFTDKAVWVFNDCHAVLEVCLSAHRRCRRLRRKPNC